jgi:hypothetical protein
LALSFSAGVRAFHKVGVFSALGTFSESGRGNPTKGTFLDDLLFAGVVPSPGNVWILGNEDEGAQGGMGTLAIHTITGK